MGVRDRIGAVSPWVRWTTGIVTAAVVTSTLILVRYESELPPIKGLGFAPFRDCQSPERGVFPSIEQLRQDVELIRDMGNAVRTYSALNGAIETVAHATELGMRVSAGAWLGPENTAQEREANRQEIEAVIALASRFDLESVIVGNEVMLRHDLSPQRLAEYVRYVRSRVKVPVTTAEIASIAMLAENRVVVDAVDYLMVHIYPYWDGVDIDGAAWYVADVYHRAKNEVRKKVVIGETGWPSGGLVNGKAVPNTVNAGRFLAEWVSVARSEDIDYYYFAAFDEKWKFEGGVGPFWGIYDSARRPKYPTFSLSVAPVPVPPRPSVTPATQTSSGHSSSGGQSGGGQSGVLGDRDSFALYHTWPAPTEYVPSGVIGDGDDVTFTDCAPSGRDDGQDPAQIDYAVRVDYKPSISGSGWVGRYWQNPADNWGDKEGGLDLRGFTALTLFAKGEHGGERVHFFSGGIVGKPGDGYPDSLTKREITVTLDRTWQKYVIDLRGGDLSRVVGGFGWSASRADNPDGAVFYVDDIQFDKTVLHRPCFDRPSGTLLSTVYIMDGSTLCANQSPVGKYELGVDSSSQNRGWLRSDGDALRMDYPGQQLWGAVFLTVGDPVPPGGRPGQDFSQCHTLQVDMRSDTLGSGVGIGMKDKDGLDDGKEVKIRIKPTSEWATTSVRLTDFDLNLAAIYVVIEFVFGAADPQQTIYVRNVRLLCG